MCYALILSSQPQKSDACLAKRFACDSCYACTVCEPSQVIQAAVSFIPALLVEIFDLLNLIVTAHEDA